jgi:hypothetical protein
VRKPLLVLAGSVLAALSIAAVPPGQFTGWFITKHSTVKAMLSGDSSFTGSSATATS